MTKITDDHARILIAADQRDNADLILRQLEEEFGDVRAATERDRAAQDFEDYEPDVVVLAFEEIAGARGYLQAMRAGPIPVPEHRTVILCSRAECALVVERCNAEEFDDYVLYWPQPYDGFRLAMSVRVAYRAMAAIRTHRQLPSDILGRARHVTELDRILEAELGDPGRRDDVQRSVAATESEIVRAVDAFGSRLQDEESADWIEVKDRTALTRELDGLKNRQIETTRRAGANELAAMRAQARQLKDKIEPSLAGARSLADGLYKLRPVVLVVEDDEFARQLVARTLDPQCWEAVFANDGASAMRQLARSRPDVILMDVRLPDIDGVSLTQQLKASPDLASIPVIMMTGDARKETLLSSLAAGAAGFIVKPFTRAVLSMKLAKLFPP